MAAVSVFNEKNTKSYKHTFKTQLEHLNYLMNTYVVKDEKVKSRYFTGINCDDDPRSAYEDFINTKIEFNKYNPDDKNSREFKHYSISFLPEESKILGAENINKICKEIIMQIPEFKNFQISIATHEDKNHIHSHIIINSVNMINGKKIQLPKSFLIKFQYICNEYTKNIGLKEHTLPNELKIYDKNTSYNKIDYNNHLKGKISKTEAFARKIEDIIKSTHNRAELFKAIKKNNMFMKWTDDEKYKNELKLGKITIMDNKTGEKHRLESLFKTYNLDVSSNIDLMEHFKNLYKIQEIKNKTYIENLNINNKKIKEINNIKELEETYKNIKKKINIDEKFKDIETSLYNDISNYADIIYNNSSDLQNIVKDKVKELLIQAKDINKELNFKEEENSIKLKIHKLICKKIYNIIKNEKVHDIKQNTNTKPLIGFLLQALIDLTSGLNRNNINNSNKLHNLLNLQKEKELEKAIKQAITY